MVETSHHSPIVAHTYIAPVSGIYSIGAAYFSRHGMSERGTGRPGGAYPDDNVDVYLREQRSYADLGVALG